MANPSSADLTIPTFQHNGQPDTEKAYTQEAPGTPYSTHESMVPNSKTYSAMYDRAMEAKLRAGEGTDHFYSDLDVLERSPKGWPSIPATQMYMPNYDSRRIFKSPTNSVLTVLEQKIDCIVNKLDEMNFKDEATEGGQALKSLPFNREAFITRCLQGPEHLSTPTPGPLKAHTSNDNETEDSITNHIKIDDRTKKRLDRLAERENLYTCLGILLKEHFTLLHMHTQNLKYPRVSRRAHKAHFEAAQNKQNLDNAACAYLRYIDDWVSPEPDTIFQRFEAILYTRPKGLIRFLKNLCCLICRDSSTSQSDPRIRYSLRSIKRFFQGLLGIICMILLLAPVSLLYMSGGCWSRGVYLGIVVASSSVFCIVMAIFEADTARMLVGLAAFLAVLTGFLSNNIDGSCSAA